MKDVSRLLESVGKKIFIDYYNYFKNINVDKRELAEKLLLENPNANTIGGQVTRVNCARRIFENNLEIEALNIIIKSRRLDEDTINKAENLLRTE